MALSAFLLALLTQHSGCGAGSVRYSHRLSALFPAIEILRLDAVGTAGLGVPPWEPTLHLSPSVLLRTGSAARDPLPSLVCGDSVVLSAAPT